ncbi:MULTISPECIES: hypothetical protein [Crocosphaera]|uniref:Uncharacterized protein n=4 Tax=Crocosphaera watsonii TaxID=263511 RepID=T2JV23_CROWT|nr:MULTISPECIES: hypothetical protein [Crocosphaera]EHJ13489.1 hypothetical protein CWATWH0003_1830 [Crocosphaera watsonii WH 0003]MCH2244980.1 hypothetical protein [Crocosphaera sp.]CCQ61692.1 hypothetical protein CWATWH0401_3512 [Crocosphaera watsonii WH 0401]CCQ68924.1 hypothetical protein CWATWH0402_3671 [Crocosphaera watsonii WH 0402]
MSAPEELTTEVSQPVQSEETSPPEPEVEENPTLFQAIGTLKGKPEQDEEGNFLLRLGGKRYKLFIAGYRYQAWLKQMAANPDKTLFLRVYPKCLMIPRKDPQIYFQVAAWEDENPWEEQPGIFKFRGVWQFVPQVRTPVISVYRNQNANDPKGKFKASHLPVLMRREDEAKPFRFNPKIAKEDLPPRWFVQGNFKFIPSRNCWGWDKDLEPPTKKIPRYKKPIKATADGQAPPRGNKKPPRKTDKPKKPTTDNKETDE